MPEKEEDGNNEETVGGDDSGRDGEDGLMVENPGSGDHDNEESLNGGKMTKANGDLPEKEEDGNNEETVGGGDSSRDKNTSWRSKKDPRICLLYTSPSPRDLSTSRMPSSA